SVRNYPATYGAFFVGTGSIGSQNRLAWYRLPSGSIGSQNRLAWPPDQGSQNRLAWPPDQGSQNRLAWYRLPTGSTRSQYVITPLLMARSL
ncbi:MAG: hypothetical protein WCP96_22540, partial [Methylococcaceae bacterium]